MAENVDITKRVEAELEKIRPRLQADGGDVRLVEIDDGIVKVSLEGACRGCPMSSLTLHMGIERELRSAIPEVKAVENVDSKLPPEFIERIRHEQAGN
ncbi:MAG: NifU family protein [Vulcanimicrobiota bacterium]